jgi:hypothetical protein
VAEQKYWTLFVVKEVADVEKLKLVVKILSSNSKLEFVCEDREKM